MATKITIGGTEYSVPEMNFCGVERAWPFVDQSMRSLDAIQGAAAGICVIVAGIVEAEDFDPKRYDLEGMPETLTEADRDKAFDILHKRLKRQLKANEMHAIATAVNSIVMEAGLVAEPGELPTGEANPSTETVADTSQSSSQPGAPEATGTA